MKGLFLVLAVFISQLTWAANSSVDVKIESLNNVANSTAIEVCGMAKSSTGSVPILVTVKHEDAQYSTLTSPDGHWCTVIKRWDYSGNVSADGVALKDLLAQH